MKRHPILIIEDDCIVAEIYRKWLEREGYRVVVARDGQEGFYRLYEVQPAAVLLDLMLPKINGITWLKKVRAQREFKALPVIAITNAFVPVMVQNATDAGASVVFGKSTCQHADLLKALHELLHPAAESSASPTPPEAAFPATLRPPAPPAGSSEDSVPVSSCPPAGADSSYRQNFFAQAPSELQSIRTQLTACIKAADPASQTVAWTEFHRLVHALTSKAAVLELHPLAQVGSAVEALVGGVRENPSLNNPSTHRILTQAADLLDALSHPDVPDDLCDNPPVEVMMVDDDPVSRRLLSAAVERAFLYAECADTPEKALDLACQRLFDAIFLDVRMPGMDGFQLCEKIRTISLNRATPIVFVTSLSDFKTRVQSTLSGAEDFIVKPFTALEVAVKAIVFSLKNRLRNQQPALQP